MAFARPLRRYQSLALAAFEQQRSANGQRAYLVLPPGAGKTVLGLEAARRLGQRAVCLCPNTAVQAQWVKQWSEFQPASVPISADPLLTTPLTALTYQSLCSLDTEQSEVEEHALDLWRRDLEQREGLPSDAADARIDRLRSTNRDQFRQELGHYRDQARSLLTQGGSTDDLLRLLHRNGRAIVDRARAQDQGPVTLVLDECHHLLELWGYLVHALIDYLGPRTFVIGLTATPPEQLTGREAALYHSIFGEANFSVPTPAVVKEGDLAPYQELAYFVQPLDHEAEYVAAQHERFEAFVSKLLDPDFATCSLVEWIRKRVVERRSHSGAALGWATFERDRPALAQAAIRFLHAYNLELPDGIRLTERFQQPLTAEDWVALIEDFSLGYLRTSTDPLDHQQAWDAIHAGLPSLGYSLTVRGVRSAATPIDRVLALSGSKGIATTEILRVEHNVLSQDLRALVLCDFERANSEINAALRGVLDPEAGSAMLVLRTLIDDPATSELSPTLVTARTVACSRATAVTLSDWIARQQPELREPLEATLAALPTFESTSSPDSLQRDPPHEETPASPWADVVTLDPVHPLWRPRVYVPLLTRAFEEGVLQCLIGTRALLGEGWDAQRVNVLVDLTAAGTSVAVHQMRGRTLRLDPHLPRKVADNWDVVCIAPEYPKGDNDYVRFVRKHERYFAPTTEGEIESGVSHVHHALSPFGPPAASTFADVNSTMALRARDREGAFTRWAIGTPYENAEIETVRMRFGHSLGLPGRDLWRNAAATASGDPLRRAALTACGTAVAGGVLGLLVGSTLSAAPLLLTLVGLLCGLGIGLVLGGNALRTALVDLGPSDALEDMAAAVAEALRATGGLHSPGDVRVTMQDDGYYRCYLSRATRDESTLFAESMDELLAPLMSPRYIIPRAIAPEPPSSSIAALRLAVRTSSGRPVSDRVAYHEVPSYLAANKTRVQAFEQAWHTHVSPGEALYYQDPRAAAIIEVQRGENPFATTSQMRTLWQ
jgi:superfamily II DNA or RNA helicase